MFALPTVAKPQGTARDTLTTGVRLFDSLLESSRALRLSRSSPSLP